MTQRAPVVHRAVHDHVGHDAAGTWAEADLAPGLNHLTQGGRPLSPVVRAFFEPRFGYDFGRVRVQTNRLAETSAASLSARAFTMGNVIAFAAGNYRPQTAHGAELLAHELTHVVQQDGLGVQGRSLDNQLNGRSEGGSSLTGGPGAWGSAGNPTGVAAMSRVAGGVHLSQRPEMPSAHLLVPVHTPSVLSMSYSNGPLIIHRSGECDGKNGFNCNGVRCTTATGRRGQCQWGGIANGCNCRDQSGDEPTTSRVLDLLPSWLVALLGAAAIAAIIACFATGVCEAGALIAAAGAAAAAIIIPILRESGVTVNEGGSSA